MRRYTAVRMGQKNWRGGDQYAIESANKAWIAQHMSERLARLVARLLNEHMERGEVRGGN